MPPPEDYLIDQGHVYSFNNFSNPVWKELLEHKLLLVQPHIPSNEWAQSNSFDTKSKFIKLLNRCLSHLCNNNGTQFKIPFSKEMKCHLFAAEKDRKEGRLRVFALKQTASRTVYKAIPNKKSEDSEAIQHWQHEAFRHKFVRFGKQWFLLLTPFWAFTCDGSMAPSKWQKKSSANMRKPEKNRAVLGHVMFWASVLCKDVDMFHEGEHFQLKRPITLSSSPSIEDNQWFKVADKQEQDELNQDMFGDDAL